MKQIFFVVFLLSAYMGRGRCAVITSGRSVVINHPVSENLYLVGGTVTINAPVHGDVVVAGGTIYINDTVTNEILVAGGNVTIAGYVGSSVRCFGGTLRIGGEIRGDLVVAGGNISMEKGALVTGDVLAAAGALFLYGKVGGSIRGRVAELKLFGETGGGVAVRGGGIDIEGVINGPSELSASSYLDIGDEAVIKGDVRYWSADSVNWGRAATGVKVVRDEGLAVPEHHRYWLGGQSVWVVLWYLGMGLVLIMLLQYLLGPVAGEAGQSFYNAPLRSLGAGFLLISGVPVIIVLACLTLVGIPVGLILLLGYASVILCSGSIASVVLANWLNKRDSGRWRFWKLVASAMGFFVLLRLIFFVPLLGLVVYVLIVCMTIGAILLNVKWRRGA